MNRSSLWALGLSLTLSALGCSAKQSPPLPPLEGRVSLSVEESLTATDGQTRPQSLFAPRLKAALEAKGLSVGAGEAGAVPPSAVVRARIRLAEEAVQESRVGGPVPFFFVNGAYDLTWVDPRSGQTVGRVQGPLDLRQLKEKGLPSAHSSYQQTAQAIADEAAPRMAEEAAQGLFRQGLLKAAGPKP